MRLETLLPGGQMPTQIQEWVDGGKVTELEGREFYDAVDDVVDEWLTEAIIHAHEHASIKQAERKLLRTSDFTPNLGTSGFATLKTKLEERLQELAKVLKVHYNQAHLKDKLGPTVLGPLTKLHPLYGEDAGGGRGRRPSQTNYLLPGALASTFNLDARHQMHEHTVVHVVAMVALAVSDMFNAKMALFCQELGLNAAQLCLVPAKAPSRMINKVGSDYWDTKDYPAPRAGYNIDVLRCMIVGLTPTELLRVFAALCSAFDPQGAAQVKNLVATDPEDREERFHLLPVMVTLIFDVGLTFQELAQLPETQARWDTYCKESDDASQPRERWQRHTQLARAHLSSAALAAQPVKLLVEAQLLLGFQAKIREMMHEVYKAFRAANTEQLYLDYLRTSSDGSDLDRQADVDADKDEPGDSDRLHAAAHLGQLDVVRRILDRATQQAAGGSAKDGTDTGASALVDRDVLEQGDEDDQTAISIAALQGHVDVVHELVLRGCDIDAGSKTALRYACEFDYRDMVMVLLELGADVGLASGEDAVTPLHAASQEGYAKVVQMLLAHKADPNQASTDDDTTALRLAPQANHVVVTQMLIDANADVNLADDEGVAPLHMAAEEGSLEVARILIKHSADVNQHERKGDATPLFAAAKEGNTKCVALLLGSRDIDVNKTDDSGTTPLSIAAHHMHTEVVDALLAAPGVDATRCGETPLWWAAWRGDLEAVAVLLADPSVDTNQADSHGGTPLFMAASQGHAKVVETLIGAPGIDVNKYRGDDKTTPLSIGAYKGYSEVVAALLSARGINVNLADDDGYPPISLAASKGHSECVVSLLASSGIAVNETDDDGKTPLYHAAGEGAVAIVAALLARPDIEINRGRSKDGVTPL